LLQSVETISEAFFTDVLVITQFGRAHNSELTHDLGAS